MTNQTPPQTWEELFDIQFPSELTRGGDYRFSPNPEAGGVKDFIRAQRKQACREMIEYMKKQNKYCDNDYLIDVAKEFLKKMP